MFSVSLRHKRLKISYKMKTLYYIILSLVIILANSPHCFAQTPTYDIGWYNNEKQSRFYKISTKEELNGLSHLASNGIDFKGDTISIINNITADSYISTSSFAGTLLGNNHSISNLSVPLIIILTQTRKVDGLTINNSSTTYINNGNTGFFASYCEGGTISNCTNKGNISISAYQQFPRVGGICGYINGGKVVGCYNYGTINVSVSGNNSATYVIRCGGIVGLLSNSGKVIACNNFAKVYGNTTANVLCGGIIGDLQNSSIAGCTNSGQIESFISPTTSSYMLQNTGGVVGRAQTSQIDKCTNKGSVKNNTDLVAGIVGYCGYTDIYNCINNGNVTSTEYYYFSCANGITSYFNGKESISCFINCINTGSISSTSKGYTATAGGICYEIKNAMVANCKNLGSVSASAPGGYKFTIQNYELTNCTESNSLPNIEEANAYVHLHNKEKKTPCLLEWSMTDNDLSFGDYVIANIEPKQGSVFIQCFSQKTDDEFKIKYSDGTNSYEENTKKKKMTLQKLRQNSVYNYEINPINESTMSGIHDTFTPLPIVFTTTISEIGYTSVKASTSLEAIDVNITQYGYQYKETSSGTWITDTDIHNGFDIVIDKLKDNTSYLLRPYVIIKSENEKIEGGIQTLTTQELIPVITLKETGIDNMVFQCNNTNDLSNYNYGLIVDNANSPDIRYLPDTNGTIAIDSLHYGTSYHIKTYIEKNEEICHYDLGIFSTTSFGTCKAYKISPKAAMIHGIANGGSSSKGKPYSKQIFEYRNLYDPANTPSLFKTPILIDEKYDYWTTLEFDKPGIYQYRLKVTTNYPTTSSYYEEKFGEWLVVNTSENICVTVPPCFFNMKSSKSGNAIILSAVCVEGEGNITEAGIEYRIENLPEYTPIKISSYIPDNGTLSYNFTTLVNGYNYYCRFYAKCGNNIYYSDNIRFDANGNYDIISGIHSVAGEKSNIIDYALPMDIAIYSIEGKQLYSYKQIYFSLDKITNNINISKGTYIVEFIQNSNHLIRKILVP